MTKFIVESNVGGTGTLTLYAPSTSNVATIELPTSNGSLLTTASTGLNASNITEGTLANARTTASSSNGASTIVLRDASGNFSANIITADGSALTAINASNISSGTLANARTTASSSNGASTIVARGASGEFSAGTITATFSGDGSGVTGLNGSNVSSGTVANARTTASSSNGASTIVARGASGEFAAGTITATFSGDGSAVTSINGSNISSGTVANARTTASSSNGASTIVARGASGEFAAGTITATFSGDGSSVTAINGSNISSGTVAVTRGGTGQTTYTDGQLLIGNTTGNTLTKAALTGTANQIIVTNGSGSITLSAPQSINTASNVQFGSFGVGTAASGTTGEIRATNNVTAYYSSDRKFKENIKPIPNAVEIVSAIGGVMFDWTDDYLSQHGGEDGYFVQKSDFGVIAQDVLKVFPTAVRTREDGSLAVDYEKLSALAFAAIKELKERIEKLEG